MRHPSVPQLPQPQPPPTGRRPLTAPAQNHPQRPACSSLSCTAALSRSHQHLRRGLTGAYTLSDWACPYTSNSRGCREPPGAGHPRRAYRRPSRRRRATEPAAATPRVQRPRGGARAGRLPPRAPHAGVRAVPGATAGVPRRRLHLVLRESESPREPSAAAALLRAAHAHSHVHRSEPHVLLVGAPRCGRWRRRCETGSGFGGQQLS